jgi:phenylpyruvate tautomerase PptA (4-oxalocrotonate tautomerase family)
LEVSGEGRRSKEETEMPFINVKLIEGVFDAAQNREIGGNPLTTADVKNLAAGHLTTTS